MLLIAAALRLWRIEDLGIGTDYYAAAVRSMMQGWSLFFFNSFDPASYLSLDKPPIAFWIQTAFAKVLGFSGLSIHLPQALAGVASVAILDRLVARRFGAGAGLIAAFCLALAPIAVAIDRSNNTDSWLLFFLLLAAWAALRGSGRALVGSMALLGLAFNVKMLAALVCGPALLASWLLASELDWRRKLGWMAAAGTTLVAVSLSWAAIYDLTPRDQRPYAGSSDGNSMLELIVMHNGVDRFVRNQPTQTPPRIPGTAIRLYDAVPVGPLRLASPNLAGQFAWFLPIALLGLAFGWRRDRASIALWGLWALAYGIVFSLAGGIFHIYYLSALTPPLAALAGIGAIELWRRGRAWLAGGLAATAVVHALITAGQLGWTSEWLAAPAMAILAAAVALRFRSVGLVASAALLVAPGAWALSAIYSPGNRWLPSASLARWLRIDDGRGYILSSTFRAESDDPKLFDYLVQNRGKARFIVASSSTRLVAPIIANTGQPAMAIGGYTGRDPITSVDGLAAMVERGELRFVLLTTTPDLGPAAVARQREIGRWVRANGKRVDPELWRTWVTRPMALYDLSRD